MYSARACVCLCVCVCVSQEVTYELVKPKNAYQPNKAPFDGTTTHKEAFVQREVVPPPKAIVRQTNIPTSNHPFEVCAFCHIGSHCSIVVALGRCAS